MTPDLTPEEKFKRLRNEELWRDIRIPRGRTHQPVQRSRVWQWAVPVAAGLVVAAVVVVGLEWARDSTPLPPAVATPTPTARAESLPWQSPPEIVFGGECSAVFTSDEISNALGSDAAVPAANDPAPDEVVQALDSRPDRAVLRHNGGLECRWSVPGDDRVAWLEKPGLVVTVVPADAVDDFEVPTACEEATELGCAFAIESNGYLLSGRIYNASDPDAGREYLASAFTQRVAALVTVPGVFGSREGDWPADIDCESLAQDPGILSALDRESYTTFRGGTDDVFPLDVELATGHGQTWCEFSENSQPEPDAATYWGMNVLSGGAWTRPAVEALPETQSVDIPGADAAMIVTAPHESGDTTALYVYVGTNMFVTVPALADAVPAMIEALEKQS